MTPSGIYKNYELVVGLEIHVQLDTNSKLFCCAAAGVSSQPNEHVGAVSLGLPGALPILNEQAVQYAIMAGLALGCDIQETSVFARKHYFYPDLPKGYQISQYDKPLCLNGYIQLSDGKKIGITRIHMEEDAGKLVHQGASGLAGSSGSLVDLNRAGIPLIEIVSEPDIRTPQEAREYMEKVHEIVRFIGVCDGDLEKGSFRCDANVSVRPVGAPQFGTRTETKNLNSFRSVEQAIQHEFYRQVDALLAGEPIVQQTRHYDDATGTTTALRTKEEAHDYRYFPDPDLKPLVVTTETVDAIRQTLPELPDAVRSRYKTDYALPDNAIEVLIQDRNLHQLFNDCQACIQKTPLPELAKWLVGPIQSLLKTQLPNTHFSPSDIAWLLDECASGKLSKTMVKDVLEKLKPGMTAQELVNQQGGGQISDQSELVSLVQSVMAENPDVVKKIQDGKVASANFLMGKVMKLSQGRAKPDTVRALILEACGVAV